MGDPMRKFAFSGLAIAAVLAGSAPAAAQGDLIIAPTRLVLDGRRGGEVILSNIGTKDASYRVTLELRRMQPDGTLEDVAPEQVNATEKAALEMVRYAPRRVTLPPDQPQSIRVSARPGPEVPDGEYRVHLTFNAVPDTQTLEQQQQEAAPGDGFSINLTPIYGITMPIIIRKGVVSATASLSNPRITQSSRGPAFEIEMSRSGTASVYGDLVVTRQGSNEPVFLARGIGIYPEITQRHVSFALTPEQASLIRGPVRVEYREPVQTGAALIAGTDVTLP